MKKLRKILAVFLSLTLAFGSLGLPADLFEGLWEDSVIGAEALETLTYGNYEYQILSNGTVALTKYTGSDSVVNIPSKINGKKVVYLWGTFQNNTNLTSVNIPNSVTEMSSAFLDCTSLISVNIPDSVNSMYRTFSGCTSLTSVNIPDSVTNLKSAFYGCTSLTSVNIPDSVTDMDGAFYGCTSLTSVNIPDSVTDMDGAFYGCTSLTSVNIPNSVTSIIGAFQNCTSLTNVNISDSVTNISYVFQNCTNLTSIDIPDSVTVIDYAFKNCTSLTSVNIPDSVEWMNNAFYGCTSLTDIEVPNSVLFMFHAFSDCTSLTSVNIPNSVTDITGAFQNCTSLTTINIPRNVTYIASTFHGCVNLTSINIPDSVTNINGAFNDCKRLTNITIPDNVTEISSGTFYSCTNLKSVTIPDSVTAINSYAFYNCPNLTIRCYKGSYAETYAIENNIPYKIIGVSGKIIDVTLEKTTYAYTGSEIKPKVVAKYDDVTLTEGTDYTVSYKDNKKIGTGAVIVDFKGKYSGRKTLNFKITDGELPDKPAPEYCFYINIVDEDGISLSGCTATCNGEDVTVTGTHLFLEDIEKDSTIIVEKEGYYPEIISTESYFNEDKSILTVTMYKKTSGEAHKLASAILQTNQIYEDVSNTDTTMAIKESSNSDLDETVKITCKVLSESNNVEEYQLYCSTLNGDYQVATSDDGYFELKKRNFRISKYYYVKVKSKDNKYVVTNLCLSVVKGDEKSSTTFDLGGGKLTVDIPSDVPFFGGTKLKIPCLSNGVHTKISTNGTVEVGICSDVKYSEGSVDFNAMRNDIAKIKCGNDLSIEDFEKWSSGEINYESSPIKPKFMVIGYGKGKLNRNGIANLDVTLGIAVKVSNKTEWDIYAGSVPVHIEIDWSGSGKATATFGYDYENNKISANNMLKLDLNAEITPFVGVGCKWANLGLYGTAKLDVPIVFANKGNSELGIQRITLAGEVGVRGELGPFEKSFTITKGSFTIFDRLAANYSLGSLNAVNTMSLNSYMAKTERDLYNTANYSISENQEASAPTYNVISSDSVTDIVSDCDTGSSPQVVTCGDTTLMVYKDSDETLKYSVYNKNTNKWGSPANVDSNGSYDSGAYLYSDGEKIYVIYEESDMDLTDSTTLDEYTATLEIAAAVFNSSTGKFENYTRLTNNNQIDSRPVITVANGIPTAAWITNADSNYFGTNSTNSIVYSSYSDNAWSEPAVLSENLNSITDMNIGTVNDKIYVVYVVDSDNDLTTADDRTLYAVDIDKNINYITEGSVDNIQFTAVPEVTENAVTWYENSEIMYSSEIGGESFNVLDDCNYTISSDYVIANNRIFYVSKNENNTQLNMVNCENGWNQPICVSTSNDGYYYEHLSAAGDMVLMINSKPDFANADSENMNVSSSIAAYIPAENTNIKVNGVTYDYEYAVPDYQVPIYIDATNTGTQNIEGISVEVYKGNTKVYGNEIDYSIRAGRNESIRILLDTDETLYTGDYKVTVKPLSGTDSDLSDNTAIFNFNMSDLEITSSEYYTSDGGTVSVCVQNNSYVPVADSVITVSDSEGNVIKTIEVPNVAAREIKVYEIPASELLESGVNESFVYLTITNDAQEYDTLNNSDVISVRRFSGITIDSCEISLSKTTAPYTGSAIKPRVTIKDGDKTLVSGTDYVIRYENNINVGTATIVISGKGTYCGTVKKTFEITESTTAISNCTITIPKSSYTYTGSAIKPKVTVKNGNITLTSGTDYVVRYVNNVEVGTASIVIAGRGNYTGNVTKTFEIAEATTDISSCTITIPQSSYTYTGSAIKPKVTIKNGSAVLTSGTDYVIRYANNINVGTASIVIAGRGSYSGSVTKTFEITQQTTDISNCTITISKSSYTYTGSAIKPKVTVKNGNTTLTSGTDYVVRYADNINVGTASIVIAGRGSYSGSVTKTFNITE